MFKEIDIMCLILIYILLKLILSYFDPYKSLVLVPDTILSWRTNFILSCGPANGCAAENLANSFQVSFCTNWKHFDGLFVLHSVIRNILIA